MQWKENMQLVLYFNTIFTVLAFRRKVKNVERIILQKTFVSLKVTRFREMIPDLVNATKPGNC